MIINSPVGRFPFEIEHVRITDGRIRVEGAMGTWPTSVEIEPHEVPGLVWQVLGPYGVAVPVALALLLPRRLRRRR